ncbi:MAG: hypothetical protein A2W52_01530 [Candidatus Taylorbacteria bacterium RIFCSPHIGHO2_02_49_25]|nr:MAG: hypothetical protein A2W52_01530 [Candidatus Taylorbacteria bacterium RIFCSPHIGHO2_02_49_25]OHA35723.1 MAG: hypothetical protein A2W65_02280 [Candidatus Taylorbacteria bacterium RIFCSPLOWO2_02_50_13]
MMPNSSRVPKKYLLTGGTGFLGTFLAKGLLEKGAHLYFLVRQKSGRDSRFYVQAQLKRVGLQSQFFSQVHIVSGDTTKQNCGIDREWFINHHSDINAIWHIAGLVDFNNRERLFLINTEGMRHIIELAKNLRAHIYYVSTAYAVGASRKRELFEDALKHSGTFRNSYEESKYEGERLLATQIASGDITATIFRPSILVGHSETGVTLSYTGYYVPLFFFATLRQQHPFITGLPFIIPYVRNATLNLIPIDHSVRLILALAVLPESNGKIFHIVHPQPPTVRYIFQESLAELGYRRIYFVPVPSWILHGINKVIRIFSYLFVRYGKRVRTQLSDYVAYLTDTRSFSTKNVRRLLGVAADVPPLNKTLLQRYIMYAVGHHFGRTKYHNLSFVL